MFKRLGLAGLVLAAAAVMTSAFAQKAKVDTWVLMGAQDVDFAKGNFNIDTTKARGSYKAIRLQNRGGSDFVINKVEVRYNGGTVHNEDRQINLLEGERTRAINQGAERFVDNVTLVFKSGQGHTLMEVWGLQSAEGQLARRGGTAAVAATTTATPPATGDVSKAPTADKAIKAPAGTLVDDSEVLFGAQTVGFGVDRDVIRVGSQIGKFDKIRLRVIDNDIYLNDLKVVYAEGDAQTLAVNASVDKNTRTKWFDLKGDRFIKEIQLTYRAKPNFKGQARVEVLGQYAEGWLSAKGEGRKYNDGWVLLGAQTAGFIGFDNDVIPVGRNEGGFTKIRVNVRDRAITLNELRVIYGTGEEDVIPVKQKVDAGGVYGPIDLKGGTRVIKEVRAKVRSRFIDKAATSRGNAIVEIWGKQPN